MEQYQIQVHHLLAIIVLQEHIHIIQRLNVSNVQKIHIQINQIQLNVNHVQMEIFQILQVVFHALVVLKELILITKKINDINDFILFAYILLNLKKN